MRPLLIPYAIDLDSGVKITADEIAEIMQDPRSTIRLQSTAHGDTASRKAMRLACPACGRPLYPRAPQINHGRHYWSHLPRGAFDCPLESKRKLTPDQINARIFHGRQEGDAHKKLVSQLAAMAERDASVGSVELGSYEPPTDEMREQFPFGRFPDVKFICAGMKAVLEAQLATITLYGINGRRAFYEQMGSSLLWVMRNFDPRGPMRASVRDIVADQGGRLFSLDNDLVELGAGDNIFRLRAWIYSGDDVAEPWTPRVLTIAEAVAGARPFRWSDDFKRRWIETYKGVSFQALDRPDPYIMLNEIAAQAGLPPFAHSSANDCILALVRLLLSLEAGFVTGSGHTELISIANSFGVNGGHRALSLVRKAIERWQPELLKRKSMQDAMIRASKQLATSSDAEWGRRSAIGRMRESLFPDWTLENPATI